MKLPSRSFIKIGAIAGFVLLLGVVVVRGDTVGATFATGSGTGGLELKIDSKTTYNGILQPRLSWSLKDLKPGYDRFFKFKDIKPGDRGTTTISIHVKKNPAWVCLDFLNLEDKENGRNEPEGHVDYDNKGELSKEIEFFAWRDDGDNRFEIGEEPLFGTEKQSAYDVLKGKSYALADSKNGYSFKPNRTKYIGITWCAGDLEVDIATAKITCDAEAMGNEAQTDSMTLDVAIRAVSASQLPYFQCTKEGKYGRGNNGHGNDDDHNDDSNPGHSNDPDDDTDDDGFPGHVRDDNHNDDDYDKKWRRVDNETAWSKTKRFCGDAWNKYVKKRRA